MGDLYCSYNNYKVVPQFVSVQLVQISTISLGLMNGGYIELVIGIINQRSHHWGGTTLNG